MFGATDKSKLHLGTLKSWHRVAVHQGDFTLRVNEHSIYFARRNKVTRDDNEMLRDHSIQRPEHGDARGDFHGASHEFLQKFVIGQKVPVLVAII
jgi:hypothetical protein